MEIIRHPQTNHVFTAPAGQEEDVADLPVILAGGAAWSFWKPSEEELAMLAAGHSIALGVYGSSHPVVAVSVSTQPLATAEAAQ